MGAPEVQRPAVVLPSGSSWIAVNWLFHTSGAAAAENALSAHKRLNCNSASAPGAILSGITEDSSSPETFLGLDFRSALGNAATATMPRAV
jgi:hypothetical protein